MRVPVKRKPTPSVPIEWLRLHHERRFRFWFKVASEVRRKGIRKRDHDKVAALAHQIHTKGTW